MALYKVLNPNPDVTIGVWQISESSKELLERVVLNSVEKECVIKFRNERRKKEWLATRLLLQTIDNGEISYDEDGRPSLNNKRFISISHTKGWVSIVISLHKSVGIDIELIGNKAVRTKGKFANDNEYNEINSPLTDEYYYTLIWACKETIFKKYSRIKSLEFKNEMRLIDNQLSPLAGWLKYSVHLENKITQAEIQYMYFDNLVLAFSLND